MFIVQCESAKAWCLKKEKLTKGAAGLEVEIIFSTEWTGLSKFAVFRTEDGIIKAYAIGISNVVGIPTSVLANDNVKLELGVYGLNSDGSYAIPTLYCDLGTVSDGADPQQAVNFDVPDQALVAQILALATDAQKSAAIATSMCIPGFDCYVEGDTLYINKTNMPPITNPFSIDSNGNLIAKSYNRTNNVYENINIGPVTAYAQEKANGYTGTKSDFLALMLVNSTLSQQYTDALEAVQDTSASLTAAQQAAAEAQRSANAASASASTASTTAQSALTAVAGKQAKHIAGTVTLASGQSTWNNVAFTGVTANNTVICQPDPTSDAGYAAWNDCSVRCCGQTEGFLNFKSTSPTTSAITVNVIVLGV